MSVLICFRAESVGPVAKRLAGVGDGLVALHEDAVDFTKLQSKRPAPPVQQPPPPDPLVEAWRSAKELAEDFIELNPTRSTVAQQGITRLTAALDWVKQAAAVPAPEAPPAPPAAKWVPNVLVRWGSRVEGRADIEINTVQAVRNARDKRESRRLLAGLCPTTWTRESQVTTPAVVRPRKHHAGSRFYVCNTANEVARAIIKCGPGWYASALVDKAREFRVFVLQGRVVCVSERFPANAGDVAWNLAAGGKLINVKRGDWPLQVLRAAIQGAQKVGLDWAAVDLCTDKAGAVFVFEVNTAPGLKNPYTMEQIAWALGSIPKQDEAPTAVPTTATRWQDFIHPSLTGAADAT